jgi:hypothetical protein
VEKHSLVKSPEDLKDILVKELVNIPKLVEESNKIQLCYKTGKQQPLRLRFLETCWKYDKRLLGWLDLLQRLINPFHKPQETRDPVAHVMQVHGGPPLDHLPRALQYTLRGLQFERNRSERANALKERRWSRKFNVTRIL